ncbi:sigma-w pathway protein ysdB [Neobacillus terrae]|uniref:sigma-w pathway protein ysdB n=1 Tax=Neobacillus terrae TaxID=3034837 RepID=UPI00140829AF|nr:sigma-w pathway protein ysdB [Neobacillus terrae]NHM30548.1 sigma-w pathway protein ysdB [Neobacillus terrae]
MIWLLRIILIMLIFFLIFLVYKTIDDPKRKLNKALKKKRYCLIDFPYSIERNFFLTYKGALFEGEKYADPSKSSFEVVSIFIWSKNSPSLKGLTREDFLFLEKKIHEQYPKAEVEWKSPIKEFLLLD